MYMAHAVVLVLVDGDDRIQQLRDTSSRVGDNGHHRHADHAPQRIVVEAGAAAFQLVVHVQRDDHFRVYVDHLGRQIQVAFQIGRDDRIDHDIGRMVDQKTSDVYLFGSVGRQGIGARQVGKIDRIALVFKTSRLGVDRNAAVIAYVLVAAREHVEQRSLARVGITHQSHRKAFAGARDELFDAAGIVVFVDRRKPAAPLGMNHAQRVETKRIRTLGGRVDITPARTLAGEQALCLAIGDDHDHLGLLAAQRHVVSHDTVFDWVLQRRIEQNIHTLPPYETHLHYAAAETAVTHYLDDGGRFARFQLR